MDSVDETRFNYFTKKLWPKIYENLKQHTLIFVSSYFDFLRLKTHLNSKGAQVEYLSEYSDAKQCQRSCSQFELEKCPFLVVTERAIVFDKAPVKFC